MWLRIIIFSLAYLYSYPCHALPSVSELSLEEKVGQILMVHFNGEDANTTAKTLIQEIGVGAIIYYNWSNGLHSPLQVQTLSDGLQKLAAANSRSIPLIIAIDQEGGVVSRLKNGFTQFPGNMLLGMTQQPLLAEKSAFAMGTELLSVGITMELAPVVDINSNPHNPRIGTKMRAFGNTAATVVDFASQALKGFHRAGVITCIKHFPGHGDVEVDSHETLPVLNKKESELRDLELVPFAKLANETEAIMTAHILVPAFDPTHCTTLSKKSIDIIRNDFCFDGVVITDSLVMNGLLKNCSNIDEACIQALNAGCDILLLGGKDLIGCQKNLELDLHDVRRIHYALVDAVKRGVVDEKRLDQAVGRILKLKAKYLSDNTFATRTAYDKKLHDELAKQIVSIAIQNDSIIVSREDAEKIAAKIWKNESGGSFDGLTTWNKGENFASLGIGHFIWFSAESKEPFQETFPELLTFLQKENANIPSWLLHAKACPWLSRDEFYADMQSTRMIELRQMLFDTRYLQAIFMAKRLEKALPLMIAQLATDKKTNVTIVFMRLANSGNGLYALIDYLNFKGLGISPKESYNGEGWGLLQVLLAIPPLSQNVVAEFVDAASHLLTQRVKNSPPERQEERWLKGWLNRLNTYTVE